MAPKQKASLVKLWAIAALPLFGMAVFEVFGLGPRKEWISPSIWIVELLGTFLLATITALVCWTVGRVSSSSFAERLALGFAVGLVACGHLWPYVSPYLTRFTPFLPGSARLLVAIVGTATAFALVARVSHERLMALRIPIAGLLATVVLYAAVRRSASASFLGDEPAWLSLLAPAYLIVTTLLLVRRKPAAYFVATALVGLIVLRLASTNPQDAHRAAPEQTPTAGRTPIVLIVIDTFRADAFDHVDASRSTTPHLATFAQQADVYTNAIANASWTLPGHASIFTGRTVSGHRTDATMTRGFNARLAPEIPTLQQVLHKEGYETVGIIANSVVGSRSALVRGFDSYQHPGRGWLLRTLPLVLAHELSPGSRPQVVSQLLVDVFGVDRFATADEVVDQAVEAVEERSESLYLFLNLMDVHRPYPPAKTTSWGQRLGFIGQQLRFWAGLLPELDFEQGNTPMLREAYTERATQVDAELGRLFQALRDNGRWEDSTIVITADHGESFFENPEMISYYGHHGSYEATVRIPLLIKKPGQRSGAVHDLLVDQADIMPTLLAAANLRQVPGTTGRTLPDAPVADIITEWHPRPFSEQTEEEHDRHYPGNRIGIYRDQFKFVLERNFEEKLFDLEAGPWEQVDVHAEWPELSRDLRDSLYANTFDSGTQDAGEAPVLDPETEAQLRALGYIQ